MLKVVIIEDNISALEHLKHLLTQNFPEIIICGTSDSAKEGVLLIKSKQPELIFLDIELSDGNGFEVLENTKLLNYEVIFTTAHNNYIQKAIDHYAFYYLLKPLKLDTLSEVLNRYKKMNLNNNVSLLNKVNNIQQFLNNQGAILMINVGTEFLSIRIKNIILCKSEGNYTNFIMDDNKNLLASKSLKYYENLLSHDSFFRANRSSLINIKHILKIKNKEEITLSKKHHVTVSIRNKSKLKEILGHLT